MRITYLGKDPGSGNTQCPSIFETDRDSYLVQGWVVTDEAALAEARKRGLPETETLVEIPKRLVSVFPETP